MTSELYNDPYDVEIYANPYPVYRRLREEAPLYYNEKYDALVSPRLSSTRHGCVIRQRRGSRARHRL